MKEDYEKALKRLFFISDSVPFNGQNYLKQKGPGTSDQSPFRLQNKFRKILLLVKYCLTMFDDIKRFLSYSKNYSSLPTRRVARNKRGGGKDEPFLISVVPVISVVVGKMSHF